MRVGGRGVVGRAIGLGNLRGGVVSEYCFFPLLSKVSGCRDFVLGNSEKNRNRILEWVIGSTKKFGYKKI